MIVPPMRTMALRGAAPRELPASIESVMNFTAPSAISTWQPPWWRLLGGKTASRACTSFAVAGTPDSAAVTDAVATVGVAAPQTSEFGGRMVFMPENIPPASAQRKPRPESAALRAATPVQNRGRVASILAGVLQAEGVV